MEENKKWLNDTLNFMYEQPKLKVGQTVRVKDVDGRIKRDITGKIIDIRKHYIIIQFENFRESFNKADFYTAGRGKDKREYLVKIGKKEWKHITEEMF